MPATKNPATPDARSELRKRPARGQETRQAARWDERLARALRPPSRRIEAGIDVYTPNLSRAAGIPENDHDAMLVHARFIVLNWRGLIPELKHHPNRSVIHEARAHIRRLQEAYCDRFLNLS